jgi:putative methyltransferase (TIGR04325 family)
LLKSLLKVLPFYSSVDKIDSVRYIGPFNSWTAAVNASTGYNDPAITKKAVEALMKILSGEKKCEKDSILFDEYQYSLPLILGVNYIAKSVKNNVVVLDYGGSFASSFFRNSDILREFDIQWIVIEQEEIVEIAKEKLSNFKELEFISDSDFRQRKRTIDYDILLFGSSLQFLREPEIDIKKLINTGVKSLIFEQTPFVLSGSRQLTVQKIQEPIYNASYPAWHFDENEFMAWIGNQYEIRYKSHNPHVTNYCNNFTSTLKDFVFTEVSKAT